MLQPHRTEAYLRLQEARLTLETIKSLESQDLLTPDQPNVPILRGLFFVHLYATLEFAATRGTQAVLEQIAAMNIKHSDFSPPVYSFALDAAFRSIRDATKGKWEKRLKLITTQFSGDACAITSTVFNGDLQNVWYKTLTDLFDCLGMPSPPVPDMRLKQYIDELVEKRNAVAHGRESPATVASGLRSPDLEIRLNAVLKIIDHLYTCFETYLTGREFIRQEQRVHYP